MLQFRKGAQKADSFRITTCDEPTCQCVHIIAFDSAKRPICDITIPFKDIPKIAADMMGVAGCKLAGRRIDDGSVWK